MKGRSKTNYLYYLYGITGSGLLTCPRWRGVGGLDGAEIKILRAGGLAAIYSKLPADKYSTTSLEKKIKDNNWLETKIKEHYRVQETVLLCNFPFIPLKFCTIFKTLKKINEYMANKRDWAVKTLHYLEDKEEWGLKIFRNRELLKKELADQNHSLANTFLPSSAGAGKSFLMRKKALQELTTAASSYTASAAAGLLEKLKKIACDCRQNETFTYPGREEEDMVANFAFLVKKGEVEKFKSLVENFNLQNRGLEACLLGPWPPYNFVDAPEDK